MQGKMKEVSDKFSTSTLSTHILQRMLISYSSTVCSSQHIHNHPSELLRLQNCRVVEGFVMISIMYDYNDTDYENLTFPDLVEITDFLLLFRVDGLTSLTHLFPNLQVIRGNNLVVDNYALIVYDMLHLTVQSIWFTFSRAFNERK